MSNIIDSIQLSGTVYTLSAQTSGGGVPESAFTAYTAATDERISQDEEVTAAALNVLNESLSGKQDTLSAGTNITISGNVISAEGGGKSIEAGRGISVTTGATADTVSLGVPIYSGTGINSLVLNHSGNTASGYGSNAEGYSTSATSYYTHAEGNESKASANSSHAEGKHTTASGSYSHAEGGWTTASGGDSHAEGNSTTANGYHSHAEGWGTTANNTSEHASGQYNVSSSASTTFGDSGNTLFSVGNGTYGNNHNAFEIRQNGDIYLSSGGTDIKLQDHLGGGGTVDQTIISGSTNAVAGGAVYDKIDEVEQVTAAGLNDLEESLSGKVNVSDNEVSEYLGKTGNVYMRYYPSSTSASSWDDMSTGVYIAPGDIWSSYRLQNVTFNVVISNEDGSEVYSESRYDAQHFTFTETPNIPYNYILIPNDGYRFAKVDSRTRITNGVETTNIDSKVWQLGAVFNSGQSKNVIEEIEPYIVAINELKQDKLKAGLSINIDSANTISVVPVQFINGYNYYSAYTPSSKAVYDFVATHSGSSITVDTALDSGSTNPVQNKVIYNKIDDVEQVTAAGLNALNDNFGGLKLVKLTQAEYNALATKDSSTLYIIVN